MTHEDTTTVLVEKAKAGDKRAQGELLTRGRAWLRPYVHGLMRDNWSPYEDTEDVLSSTIRTSYEDLDSFEQRAPGGWRAWLRKVAFHKVTGKLRRGRAQKRAADRQVADGDEVVRAVPRGATPSEEAIGHELETRLVQVLKGMPSASREAYVLNRLANFSLDEVAQMQGCTHAAARGRVDRALKALKTIRSRSQER